MCMIDNKCNVSQMHSVLQKVYITQIDILLFD